ncbi:MAG: hypothetical protein ACKESB_03245 [Candidatus Hodgkinia cicadicola]
MSFAGLNLFMWLIWMGLFAFASKFSPFNSRNCGDVSSLFSS